MVTENNECHVFEDCGWVIFCPREPVLRITIGMELFLEEDSEPPTLANLQDYFSELHDGVKIKNFIILID